jgi:hypothetical protein
LVGPKFIFRTSKGCSRPYRTSPVSPNEPPNSKHSAVARSHGGNILVKALSANPDTLDAAVCLSTPFFIIQEFKGYKGFEKAIENEVGQQQRSAADCERPASDPGPTAG